MSKIRASHNTRRGKLLGWLFALGAGATFLLAACGGGSSPTHTPPPIIRTATGPSPTSRLPTLSPTLAATPITPASPLAFAQGTITERSGRLAFSPTSLTIRTGTQVAWTNRSDVAHTVISDTQAFTGSNTFTEHQTFSTVFWKPGTYAYHCSIHPTVRATILVTPSKKRGDEKEDWSGLRTKKEQSAST